MLTQHRTNEAKANMHANTSDAATANFSYKKFAIKNTQGGFLFEKFGIDKAAYSKTGIGGGFRRPFVSVWFVLFYSLIRR